MHEPVPFEVGLKALVRVGPSELHGLGVFAEQAVKAGQVIEICPTIFLSPEDEVHIDRTVLREYVYPWEGGSIVVLGFGFIYNHSIDANAYYVAIPDPRFGVGVHVVTANRAIEVGEEITVNYTGVTGARAALWFEDRSLPPQ